MVGIIISVVAAAPAAAPAATAAPAAAAQAAPAAPAALVVVKIAIMCRPLDIKLSRFLILHIFSKDFDQ